MRYRQLIEDRFLIDDPRTGELVPFLFRPVQIKYYEELIRDYDIEKRGLTNPVRDIILKARREGFSSLILALFAADDLMQQNPTETLVISYRDDATETFRKRYRLYVTSYFAQRAGHSIDAIKKNPAILDQMAKAYLSIDSSDIELLHNKAHFYCGTASARTGGRGGVLQKLLFSEEAHYPDTEKMTAREIVDGTLRQVDINAGWVFRETTANGYGNYYEQTWALSKKGESRFKPRFYGWQELYTQAEFDIIASEFTDKELLKQEYPINPEEAFLASGTGFFNNNAILEYVKKALPPKWRGWCKLTCGHDIPCQVLLVCDMKKWEFEEDIEGPFQIWEKPRPGGSYVVGGDVAEGIDGDYSVLTVIDNRTLKTVAKHAYKLSPPDEFALTAFAVGMWYNFAYTGIEANKDGNWVNKELFKLGYPNLYYREEIDDITNRVSRKLGFLTGAKERPIILSELRKLLATEKNIWTCLDFLEECLVFVRNKMGRPEAMNGKHDDHIMATAIAYQIRVNAPHETHVETPVEQSAQNYVMARLAAIKGNRDDNFISQDDYVHNH